MKLAAAIAATLILLMEIIEIFWQKHMNSLQPIQTPPGYLRDECQIKFEMESRTAFEKKKPYLQKITILIRTLKYIIAVCAVLFTWIEASES